MTPILLIGASGHASVVIDIVEKEGRCAILGLPYIASGGHNRGASEAGEGLIREDPSTFGASSRLCSALGPIDSQAGPLPGAGCRINARVGDAASQGRTSYNAALYNLTRIR